MGWSSNNENKVGVKMKKNSKNYLFLFLFSLSYSYLPLFAQTDLDEKLIEIIPYQFSAYNFIQVDIDDSEKHNIVYDALLNKISTSGFTVLGTTDINSVEAEGETLLDRALNYAIQSSSDTAVVANVFLEETNGLEQVIIYIKVYRTSDKKMIASLNKKSFIDYTLLNLIEKMSVRLYEQSFIVFHNADEENMNEEQKLIVLAEACDITVYSEYEGAEVYLSGADFLGTIQDGKLFLPFHPLVLKQEMKLTIKYPAYFDKEMKVIIDQKNIEIHTGKLHKSTFATVNLYYQIPSFAGAGVGFRLYPLKDDLYFEFRDIIFATGVRVDDNGQDTLIHNDFSLLIGYYPFFKGNSTFRFSLAAGVGYLYSKNIQPDSSGSAYHDWYISLVNINLEVNLPSVSLFLSPEIRYFNPTYSNSYLVTSGLPSFPIIINMGVVCKL